MINVNFKNIEMIPSSSAGGGEYDDTQLRTDISKLQTIKADKTELNNYQPKGNYALKTEIPNINNKLEISNLKAGNNITLSTSGNNITINSIASGGGSTANTGIRTLNYKFKRAHTIGDMVYPLFVADDYSNLKAGDLYIIKIDWAEVTYPNNVNENLFFPKIDFKFATFDFTQQAGAGLVKSYICVLDVDGDINTPVNMGTCDDTEYNTNPNGAFKPLLWQK